MSAEGSEWNADTWGPGGKETFPGRLDYRAVVAFTFHPTGCVQAIWVWFS